MLNMVTPVEAGFKNLYCYRSGGLKALENQVRKDKGRQQIPKPLSDAMANKLLKTPPDAGVSRSFAFENFG